jgi:hypothetical protein
MMLNIFLQKNTKKEMKKIFLEYCGRTRKQGIEWYLPFTFILSVAGAFIVLGLIYMGEAYHKLHTNLLNVVKSSMEASTPWLPPHKK